LSPFEKFNSLEKSIHVIRNQVYENCRTRAYVGEKEHIQKHLEKLVISGLSGKSEVRADEVEGGSRCLFINKSTVRKA
jgi:hypothetical protein